MSEERTLSRDPCCPSLVDWLREETRDCTSVVEFGCGTGAYLRGMSPPVKFGIDAFAPYVEEGNADPRNDGCTLFVGNMLEYRNILPVVPDVAVFVDSIEHLDRDSAMLMLNMCKADFKKVLVFAPIGEHIQDPCDGNIYQTHLSFWTTRDFENMGFFVVVMPDLHLDKPPELRDAMRCRWVRA